MHGILVKTGKYQEGDEKKLGSPLNVTENFAKAVELLFLNIET